MGGPAFRVRKATDRMVSLSRSAGSRLAPSQLSAAAHRAMKRQFGRYVIADDVADELGRGAFGRVYRAFDPNVNRYVAVKILSSESDPDMLNRFRDESTTAGKLEHKNIVKVYDFDLQEGMPYLVME